MFKYDYKKRNKNCALSVAEVAELNDLYSDTGDFRGVKEMYKHFKVNPHVIMYLVDYKGERKKVKQFRRNK